MFVYEPSGSGFKSRCCHLHFRYGVCLEQGVSWHSGKTIESRFTLKLEHHMTITYSQNQKIKSNKTKDLLAENEFKKLQTFDSIWFRGKSRFEEDRTQNYIACQRMYRYFKWVSCVGSANYIYFWKSRGLSDETITVPTASDYSLHLQLSYHGTKTGVKFKESYLKQDKITYGYGKRVNVYIVYEINKNFNISSYPALKNCSFDEVCWTKNADIDKYKYFEYGLGFDRHGFSGGTGRNCTIFVRYEFTCKDW